MKIIFLVVGKNLTGFVSDGLAFYAKRIENYIDFSVKIIPDFKATKQTNSNIFKQKESELILRNIEFPSEIVLLDEKGIEMSSIEFSNFINKKMISSIKTLYFVAGGAFGFSNDLYEKANSKLSLSKMTFPHQLVRVIFAEQLYRAFTILKGEPYHHE